MKQVKPWVKPALEYGPLILLFAAFMLLRNRMVTIGGTEYGGLVLATMIFVPVLMLTSFLLWRLTGKLSAMQILTLVLVVVFGGLTVWLNDGRFLKMKVTIIYAILAGLLALGLVLRKNWLELVMGEALPMAHEGWMKLTQRMM
ncbi:MAG: septation protein IspZ, partial [Paracoccus sp. (in: a-proteobacteria)]|nr:septation protein IspZ [Paracoccus sp. (in: a-proteobacteria)]